MLKKLLLVATALMLTACPSRKETATLYKGDKGDPGTSAHSLVSEYNQASGLECANGGARTDIYLDLNDDLTADEGDLYMNSLVACNGSNGNDGQNGIGTQGPQGDTGPQGPPGDSVQGPQGPQGEPGTPGSGATITAYTPAICTQVPGTSAYIKGSNNNVIMYSSSSCSSNSKIAEISQGESYWAGPMDLVVYSSSSTVRVIHYN